MIWIYSTATPGLFNIKTSFMAAETTEFIRNTKWMIVYSFVDIDSIVKLK